MRLGAWNCKLDKKSLCYSIYKNENIQRDIDIDMSLIIST